MKLFLIENQSVQWLFYSVPEACNFIKIETLAQVFSSDFCKISKNTFSYSDDLKLKVFLIGFLLILKKYCERKIYRISSHKRLSLNKRRTFGYPHWNKRLLLISASPLRSTAPLNTVLIRIVTIFPQKLKQNAYGTSMQTIKQCKYCLCLDYYLDY